MNARVGVAALFAWMLLAPWNASLASSVIYYPGFGGGVEPPWALYSLDFSAFQLGSSTPLSETVGSLTVSYSAPNDPSAFSIVAGSAVPGGTSNAPALLGAPGSDTLLISFSSQLFGLGMRFAATGVGPITLTFLLGGVDGKVVASTTESDLFGHIGLLPVCVCDNYFDAAILTGPNLQSFALLDMIAVRVVPEPSTVLLLALGLVTVHLGRRRNARFSF